MAIGMFWSLYILMVLFSVCAAHSHTSSHGLVCTNDFVNNISCTWTSTPVAPGVDCWISGVKKYWIIKGMTLLTQGCKLKQHRDSLPGCSFVFENKGFSDPEVMPNISMKCNGTLMDTLENYKPKNHIKMNPPGVPTVSISANETWISWSRGSPVSEFFKSFDFEVEIKQNNQPGKARTSSTQKQELRLLSWQLKGPWQVRVRVKPTNRISSHWSNWSPTTSLVEATDRVDTSDNQERWLDQTSLVIGALTICFTTVLILAFYNSCKTKRLLKGKLVPNPSEYFCTLHSVHEGNLKNWLNPLSVSESFFTAHPCDQISPVEVCEDWDVVPSTSPSASSTSALVHFQSYPSADSDTSGVVDSSSSSSCFSNLGYFLSSSSRSSAQTDPSPAYFTYQDDFTNLHSSHHLHPSLCPSVTTGPTYETLKREPQSPDSGFAIRKKNEKDVYIEEEQVLDDQKTLLIFPLHLPSQMCPSSTPPTPPSLPTIMQISSDSQQVDIPETADSGWLVTGAMCRSSSMPVESCKTGYLTLKELQTTFSNKSI
ncbi:interleukin-2 receptor subunit beta [Embiotoca jacksoni]|uniref:interleukin-2 receptor subunit beta n=1 Tax=Embiotoca jacksoni TaxID=100190 RepID=UPI003704724C